jgi:hypothetical protein
MNNFKLLKSNLDLREIREELARSTLWVQMDSVPGRARTQAHSSRIQLRTNAQVPGAHYHEIQESRDLPAWEELAATRAFVVGFAREVGGEIGRVRASKLHAGATIVPHVDIGGYCAIRDRYHLVIRSPAGTEFTAGEDSVIMRENELWWFDNKKLHSVRNPGPHDRIHLIFDLLPHMQRLADARG